MKNVVLKAALFGLVIGLSTTEFKARAYNADEVLSDLQQWTGGTYIDPRIFAQMDRFEDEDDNKTRPEYQERLAAKVRRTLLDRAEYKIRRLQNSPCKAEMSVAFLKAGALWNGTEKNFPNQAESEFETGMIRIESTGCLNRGTPEKALDVFFYPGFRQATVPFLTESYCNENGDVCETIDAPRIAPVSDMSFAMAPRKYVTEKISVAMMSLVNNRGDKEPVFFQESLVMFVKTDAGLVWYSLGYARGETFSEFTRRVMENRLGAANLRAAAEMQSRLR